jgi:hypothetical protein
VPPLRLPFPQHNTQQRFEVSHPIDDSDIAFVMRLDRGSAVCSYLGNKGRAVHKTPTAIDGFVNLATLNYILAGIQLCYRPGNSSAWFDLLHDLDKLRFDTPDKVLGLRDLVHIVRNLIRPFGVVRGSEKQGGQSEATLAAATWPVNFVCTMVVDGKERNVVNVWHHHDISAGDDLVLRLKPMPIPAGRGYTLNHYYKHFVQQSFDTYLQPGLGRRVATHVWQLVPDVHGLDGTPENDHFFDAHSHIHMETGFGVPKDYIWQEWGYWHIGRSQVMFRRYSEEEYYNDDMANQLKVNHLDLTFEPCWQKVPGARYKEEDETVIAHPGGRVPARVDPGARRLVSLTHPVLPPPPKDVLAAPVAWAPCLRLEQIQQFLAEPPPAPPSPQPRPAAAPAEPSAEDDANAFAALLDHGPPAGLGARLALQAPAVKKPRRQGKQGAAE